MQVNGIVVSSGIAFGQALNVSTQPQPLDLRLLPLSEIESEKYHLRQSIALLIQHLQKSQQRVCPTCENFQLIDADILLLEDEELVDEISQHISQYRVSAPVAVNRTFNEQAQALAQMDDPYLANRSQDIRFLAKRLIAILQGSSQHDLSNLTQATILLADDLTPADFAMLPLDYISGIVLESGGLTSHTAILARAAGIPALLNCPWINQVGTIADNTPLVLDAFEGVLYVKPDPEQVEQLSQKQQQQIAHQQALMAFKDLPCQTIDGRAIILRANVGNLNEISHLMEVGAQGIGLFRTEFLLMNAKAMPDEDQQYKLYCDAIHTLNGQPLTIRTFDVGADKEIPCLKQNNEDNPALGVRGIRYSLLHQNMFITQVKAILRAANTGSVRLMFPMISKLEELQQAFALIEQAKTQLIEQQQKFAEVEYGIVVETPAAALTLDAMLPYLHFVSIGSNDLTQYTLAADRSNTQLAHSYPTLSPAVLKLVAMIIAQCKQAGVKVCLCGEIGGDETVLPLLMGMGLDELSINPNHLLAVKSQVVKGQYSQFVEHAAHINQLNTISAIDEAIKQFSLVNNVKLTH
ncbi:phosphoenolpyruvate--protein phosphotransferase [Shewanella aestuarii]|uniref:Phosphoenolpyruvate-protein phosphotransferase n=1 Tax=Shewanella aestuarii TaxID=1028752 RepID=A0A6G9QJH0_9GAMM|nr:phosphoenolpyruvate--protein phosphotransferase [Shewanella aestuarii]QIR14714.1 phosphoenolpyruvate--protein phosphotransferase [Shewanella aestuarii]